MIAFNFPPLHLQMPHSNKEASDITITSLRSGFYYGKIGSSNCRNCVEARATPFIDNLKMMYGQDAPRFLSCQSNHTC